MDIKFIPTPSGVIASPKLQSSIIEAIKDGQAKGLDGINLCTHVKDYMNDHHGKFWYCAVGPMVSICGNFRRSDDSRAMLEVKDIQWALFKGAEYVQAVINQHDFQQLQHDKKIAHARIALLNAELQGARHELSNTERLRKKASDRLSKVLIKLSTTKTDLASTRNELLNAKSELPSLKTELENVQSELVSTKDELDSTKSELTDTLEKLSNVEDELTNAETRLSSIEPEMLSLKEELLKTKDDLTNAETELSRTKQELSVAETELEKKRQEHDEYVEKMNAIAAILDQLLRREE